MIVVCEPGCRGLSHEKVNSGFLTAVRQAYPRDEIVFHTHPSHAQAIRAILQYDGVSVEPITYRDLDAPDGLRGVLPTYFLFRRLLADVSAMGIDKILFLSFTPVLLHVLKRLKEEQRFAHFKFAFVLHGAFEKVVAGGSPAPPPLPSASVESLLQRVVATPLGELPRKVGQALLMALSQRYRSLHASLLDSLFEIKQQMLWRDGDDYRYIALSPHIARNVAQHSDIAGLRLHTVEMPINFAAPLPPPRNAHIKFASFGYGDVGALRQVVEHLSRLTIGAPYEIRIIGMDCRGLEGHPNVTCPSPGKALPRAQMEELARDIDVFLILYGRDRYRLSCSGSILEAISYVKPVLHLGNDCVEQFDTPAAPIGFRSGDLRALALKMKDLSECYAGDGAELELRRRNILRLRQELAMDKLAVKLRRSLTFDDGGEAHEPAAQSSTSH